MIRLTISLTLMTLCMAATGRAQDEPGRPTTRLPATPPAMTDGTPDRPVVDDPLNPTDPPPVNPEDLIRRQLESALLRYSNLQKQGATLEDDWLESLSERLDRMARRTAELNAERRKAAEELLPANSDAKPGNGPASSRKQPAYEAPSRPAAPPRFGSPPAPVIDNTVRPVVKETVEPCPESTKTAAATLADRVASLERRLTELERLLDAPLPVDVTTGAQP